MDLRFEMYESCIDASFFLEKVLQSKDRNKEFMKNSASEFIRKIEQCQVRVIMYGTEFEIRKIHAISDFARQNKHLEMKNEFASLMRSIRNSVREDLKLQKLSEDIKE